MNIKILVFVILYGVFALVLIALKMGAFGDFPSWSWGSVLAPVWIPGVFWLVGFIVSAPGKAVSKVWRR